MADTMSSQDAYQELTALHRHFKAFAKLDQVLQAAAQADKEHAEKQRLLDDLAKKLTAAKAMVALQGKDLADSQLAYTEKVAAAQRTYQDDQDTLSRLHQGKMQELEVIIRDVAERRRQAVAESEALERKRSETARLVAVEEAKVAEAGKAKLKTLNDQAYALQTTIDKLKLQLRSTMDEAGRLI